MKKLSITLASLLSAAAISHSAITLSFEAGSLRDSEFNSVNDGTVAVLVAVAAASTFPDQADWAGVQLVEGESLGLGKIMRVLQTDSNILPGGVNDTFVIDYEDIGVESGDKFALYWFPGIDVVGTQIAVGQRYGIFHSSEPSINSGGDIGMIFPADDGQLWSSAFYEDSFATGSGIPDNTFSANFTVIPEPSSVGLALLGVFGLMASRRR